MSARVLIALAVFFVLAPAASATTSSSYDHTSTPHTLTLTNDGSDSETYSVKILSQTSPSGSHQYVVTATNGNISVPAGTDCGGGGTKTITCTPGVDATQQVQKVDIKGMGGDDTFTIDAGTSYPYTNDGALSIEGGDGNDTFTAVDSSAILSSITGDGGNDTFNGSNSHGDQFHAEPGNDTYNGGTYVPPPPGYDPAVDPELVQRDAAADSWGAVGDAPVNISLDGAANDTDGQGGTDNVKDVEYVYGGGGNDTLTAGAASVYFDGGAGDDALTGSGETDMLLGGAGSDTITGNGGDDTLADGDSDPVYRLSTDTPTPAGNDKLNGGDGDDTLIAGDGTDDVVGGAGEDTLDYGRIQTQVFDALPDFTTFREKDRPMTVTLDDKADDGPTGAGENDNIHSDVEDVDTSLVGSNQWAIRSARAARVLIGGGSTIADDTVTGSGAANVITTGAGNDTIDGGGGPDTVFAGTGDDKITATDKVTDLIDCGKGNDAVAADLPGTNPGRADSLHNCETVTGTALGLEGGALPVPAKVILAGTTSFKVAKFVRTYTVTTTVTSDQPASVTGALTYAGGKIAKVGSLTIGSGKVKLAGKPGTLKVKVALRYRKALKHKLRTKKQRRKGIKLDLAITTTNASGQATVSHRTIRIKG